MIDVKERESRHEVASAPAAEAAEPVSRVADVRIPDEPREPRSYKGLVWLIILGLLYMMFGQIRYAMLILINFDKNTDFDLSYSFLNIAGYDHFL